MTVYIDVMFMRELIFDAILLSVTAWLLKMKWIWWKITLASTLGSLYTIALFFPSLSFMFHFTIKIAISLAMIFIAYGIKTVRQMLRIFITFYLISFLAGGVTTGLYYLFLPSANAFWKQVLLMNDSLSSVIQTSFLYLIVGFVVAAILVYKSFLFKRKQQLILENLVTVTIMIANKQVQCEALIDTGNQLYDPLTRTPVVIVEASLFSEEFPELISSLGANKAGYYDYSQLSDDLLHIWQTKIKIIPFRSVNKDGQFIVALKPDELSFKYGEQHVVTSKVLLGLDYGQLSSERQYEAILHPALIEY